MWYKMWYKKMHEYIKPKEGSRFKLWIQELNSRDHFYEMLCNGIKAGTYVILTDKEKHECVMSDTQMEQHTNLEFVREAHGKVLIGGLGIGMVLLAIQDKPAVTDITVVEKYQEVIDLVKPQLPLNSKVKVVCADIFDYEPTEKYNTIYLDIWNNAGRREIYEKEQRPLRMRYRKYLVPKSEDEQRYINCWMYEANRKGYFNWGY